MIKICEVPFDQFIDAELGKMFNQLLFEAEVSHITQEREHGLWLREKLSEKIARHARSYQ